MPKRGWPQDRAEGGKKSPPRGIPVPLISNLSCLHIKRAKYVSKYVKLRSNGQFPFCLYVRHIFSWHSFYTCIYNNEIIRDSASIKSYLDATVRRDVDISSREGTVISQASLWRMQYRCAISLCIMHGGPFDGPIYSPPFFSLSFLSRKLSSAQTIRTS